jgi:dihydroxyacetone kinase
MAGFSITLTRLDDELENLLNADAHSFAYSNCSALNLTAD